MRSPSATVARRWPAVSGSSEEALSRTLVGLAIAVLWLGPIASSLWLDELGTYWVVRGGFLEALDRALRYQGQSPLYYAIAWVARVAGQGNEIVLRLPSVAAALAAAFLVGRVGRKLFGIEGGWPSAVAFAVGPAVAFTAIDARPYAFGYLALAAATVSLINLSDRGGLRWATAYGATVAATVHFHYFFGFALLGHLPYLVSRWRGLDPSARRGLPLAGGVATALLLPLAAQVPYLLQHARIPDLPASGIGPLASLSLEALLETLIPVQLLAAALLGSLVARAITGLELRIRAERGALALAAGLWLAPSLGIYAFSAATGVNLLWANYTRSSAIGTALLLGGALAGIVPAAARRVALLVLVTIGLLAWGDPWHTGQDWRGAASEVNALVDDPTTPVLMHAAFIEGAHVEFFDEPEHRSQLLAQLSRYPVQGSVLPIPYNLTENSVSYLEDRIVPRVEAVDRFILVTLTGVAPLAEWFEARLEPLGFDSRQVGAHGAVLVTLFHRGEAP